MKTVISRGPARTRQLAKKISASLPLPAVLALYGELGTGKTQFVKGLARGLGIKRVITSPTFLLYKTYAFQRQKRLYRLCHFDLYRIKKASEIKNFGLEETIRDPNCLIVLEWPKLVQKKLPRQTYSIFFTHGKFPFERKIRIPSPLAKHL